MSYDIRVIEVHQYEIRFMLLPDTIGNMQEMGVGHAFIHKESTPIDRTFRQKLTPHLHEIILSSGSVKGPQRFRSAHPINYIPKLLTSIDQVVSSNHPCSKHSLSLDSDPIFRLS